MSSWDTNPWSNFCDPPWQLICCNKWHPRTSEISTQLEIAVRTHFHARTWHQNYPSIFTCWWRSLLVATLKFSLLAIRQHSATRKHLLLSPQDDRSHLKKPKKGQASKLITATTSIHLPKPVSTDLAVKPDSVLTSRIGKTAIWLSLGQVWVILKEVASLTRCY